MAELELTAAQRKRLAREARKLAMECVEGTAPGFETYSFCGCAAAEVVKRANGVYWYDASSPLYSVAEAIDSLSMRLPSNALFHAFRNSSTTGGDMRRAQHEALPWALLALADALESTP